jgi:hypothetical protein
VCDTDTTMQKKDLVVNPMTRGVETRKTHNDHARPPLKHDLGGNNGRL